MPYYVTQISKSYKINKRHKFVTELDKLNRSAAFCDRYSLSNTETQKCNTHYDTLHNLLGPTAERCRLVIAHSAIMVQNSAIITADSTHRLQPKRQLFLKRGVALQYTLAQLSSCHVNIHVTDPLPTITTVGDLYCHWWLVKQWVVKQLCRFKFDKWFQNSNIIRFQFK